VLVEADPDGGVLAARFGIATDPGLVTLAASTRRSLPADELARHTAALDDNAVLVAGPPTSAQAEAALAIAAPVIARGVASASERVLVDVGRGPRPVVMPLVEAATAVVLVTRPRLDQLQQVVPNYRALRSAGRLVGVVLVGEGPYGAAEVARVLGTDDREVIWGVLPDDRWGASVLNAERAARDWSLRRSPLLRAAHGLADRLAALGEAPRHPSPTTPSATEARPMETAR
jgi:MinD-like ATPase involved in chromosome partitioning or flagellar assembly